MQKLFNNRIVIAVLLIIPLLIYLIYLNRLAINLPHKDTYRLFINYTEQYLKAPSKLQMLFLPENESYPILMRVLIVLQYKLSGTLNIQGLLYLFNIFLFLFVTITANFYIKRKEYIYIAFLFLLIFNLFNYEVYYRGDVAGYQLLVLPLSIWLFYCITRFDKISNSSKVLFYLALLLNPFGSINGLVAGFLTLGYAYFKRINKRDLVFSTMIVLGQLIFLFLLKNQGKSVSVFDNIIKYNFELVYAFFLSVGGLFAVNSILYPAIVLISSVIFFYTFYLAFFKDEFLTDFERLLLVFSTISLAAVVILRYNYWIPGVESINESRYKIYSSLILFIFVVGVDRKYKIAKPYLIAFLSLVFLAGYMKNKGNMRSHLAEQISIVHNVNERVYENEFARNYYASGEVIDFLEENNVYSFKDNVKGISKNFVDCNLLTGVHSYELKKSEYDVLGKGDWSGMGHYLNSFTVYGEFPKFKYYFVEFEAGDNASFLVEMKLEPRSLLSRLIRPKKIEPMLTGSFYPTAIKNFSPDKFKVYGLDKILLR